MKGCNDLLVVTGDYGSDYGDDGYGGPAGAIMESIREEDHSPGSARSQRHAEASRFSPGPLESVPEPIPEQSVSPRQSDYGSKRPSESEAGPVRPLPPVQANAGKSAKYDEDGFLLDDDEEEVPQPPVASRAPPPTRPIMTPPKPPSEYDLAYDSSPAPSPRANQLTRNQHDIAEVPSTAAMAPRQTQPSQLSTAESAPRDLASQISRLAEEESDEDDFLAAAVAAVEAQDEKKGQPASAQRAQQVQQARPAATSSPFGQSAAAPQPRQQQLAPKSGANEAFLPSDDEASPMAVQNQQSRQGMPAIPPSIPKTWSRPSPQPKSSFDTEETPQRSEQSLRIRYGAQKSAASGSSDASAGAAAAFLAARTGSGTAPAVPQAQGQAVSPRPLLARTGSPQQQRPPGPVPIAHPPTSAYNNAPNSATSAAVPASDAPRPSSKWFRKTPPVAPPPQPQAQPKSAGSEAAYNPFDSPVSQNGDGRLSPMAIANQQQQQQQLQQLQQQKPMQEQGMYMDESEEEEENVGRLGSQGVGQGAQRAYSPERGAGQQPQMNRLSPRGAISAGVGGESCRSPGSSVLTCMRALACVQSAYDMSISNV